MEDSSACCLVFYCCIDFSPHRQLPTSKFVKKFFRRNLDINILNKEQLLIAQVSGVVWLLVGNYFLERNPMS